MEKVFSDIVDMRVRNEVKNAFDVGRIKDFDRAKDVIIPHIINKEMNASLLEQRPHKIIADLAVTYHIMLEWDAADANGSVTITYALMQGWGIDVDTLHELAIRNMPVMIPSTFRSMSSVLIEMLTEDMGDEDAGKLIAGMTQMDDQIYILSNKQGIYGATALLDKEIMQAVVDKFSEGFYIVPSSVHECIIVSASVDMDTSLLTEIIQDVNAGQVAPNERLSDHPYRYTAEGGLFSIS